MGKSHLSDSFIGFSAGGTNLLFENNAVYNGDDCLTVGNSAVNITFRNSYCNGGHGLSIGSLGKNGTVANVQNILYAIHVFMAPKSLMPSKDRKGYRGKQLMKILQSGIHQLAQENSLYGARFKSWTGGNGAAKKYDDPLLPGKGF